MSQELRVRPGSNYIERQAQLAAIKQAEAKQARMQAREVPAAVVGVMSGAAALTMSALFLKVADVYGRLQNLPETEQSRIAGMLILGILAFTFTAAGVGYFATRNS